MELLTFWFFRQIFVTRLRSQKALNLVQKKYQNMPKNLSMLLKEIIPNQKLFIPIVMRCNQNQES